MVVLLLIVSCWSSRISVLVSYSIEVNVLLSMNVKGWLVRKAVVLR
jgi:hypothetical protein